MVAKGMVDEVPDDPVVIDAYIVQMYRRCPVGSYTDLTIRLQRDLLSILSIALRGCLKLWLDKQDMHQCPDLLSAHSTPKTERQVLLRL